MARAFLNAIATAVPEHDIHSKFIDYAPQLLSDPRDRRLFRRMASRAQVDHRYSFLPPSSQAERLDALNFYRPGDFPSTAERMQFYQRHAFALACDALDQLPLKKVSHLILTSCTGFYAPGLDHQIVQRYGLSAGVERSIVGFMGCYAAMNALKLARHIVRSEADARVLVLNLELCSLHLQASSDLEELLSFLIFADGCAASIVSAEPEGLELQRFASALAPASEGQITWHIGDRGFDMHLSGQVPGTIAAALPQQLPGILSGYTRGDIAHWAVHPGGRSVLDAVRDAAELDESQLAASRSVLRRFGNMSSPTIMFVLRDILQGAAAGEPGCAMAFGPGLSVESMIFQTAGG